MTRKDKIDEDFFTLVSVTSLPLFLPFFFHFYSSPKKSIKRDDTLQSSFLFFSFKLLKHHFKRHKTNKNSCTHFNLPLFDCFTYELTKKSKKKTFGYSFLFVILKFRGSRCGV